MSAQGEEGKDEPGKQNSNKDGIEGKDEVTNAKSNNVEGGADAVKAANSKGGVEAVGSKGAEGGADAVKAEGSKKDEGGEEDDGKGGKKKTAGRGKGDKANADTCIIGFVGAGKMTEAIIRGLLEKKTPTDRFHVYSKSGKSHDTFKQMGINTTKRSYDIFAKFDSDVVFMATHGFIIKECFKLGGTRPLALTTNFIPTKTTMTYMLSLIGGIPIVDIKKVLLNPDHPDKYKFEAHRIMLNASVSRGIGLGAIDAEIDSKKVSPVIRDLLFKIAKIEHFPENQMDYLCCIGGNGMAFVYYFVSALADGGFKMGLPKKMAVGLATKTLHATALCMLESGKHPSELRDSCTSPSGPAIYGIAVLEKRDCSSGICTAIETANKRIKELVDVPCT